MPPATTGVDGLTPPTVGGDDSAAWPAVAEAFPYAEVRRFIARSNASFDETPGEWIELAVEGNTLRFAVSCNTVRVPYELIDGVLHLDDSQWATTVMACYPEDDAAAPRLGELLDSSPAFTVVGDVLTIRSSAGEVELLDATAPHPEDLPLLGVDWTVGYVVRDDTGGFISLTEPSPVVRFGADEVIVVFRCRTTKLAATIDPDARTITMAGPNSELSGLRRTVSSTTMPVPPTPPTTQPMVPATTAVPSTTAPPPCDPNTPSELEQAILPLLVGTLTYDVDIDLLHIRDTNRSGLDLAALAPPAA